MGPLKGYLFFGIVFLVSCAGTDVVEPLAKQHLIAKAGKEGLELTDYNLLFVGTDRISDSMAYSKKLIDNWAMEALLYEEALQKLSEDEIKIEKQVQDYKKTLVTHLYQTRLVEVNLDTLVSEEEIRNYYNEFRDNFLLKDNIIKVDYVKVPILSADIEKIKRLLKLNLPKDREALKELCIKNADNFFLNDSTWLYTADIKKEIPKLSEQPDFSFYAGKIVQFEDENYLYYLKIKEVKIKNALSPLHFERQNIKKYILLGRRVELLNAYKHNLLEEARASGRFQRLK